MFFCDDENLLTMELPEPEELQRRGRTKDRDLFVQLDLDAIAPKQKKRFWAAMRKRLEKVLQQHDEEDQIAYAFRKVWGELQLNLIQAVTNDLHSIRFGIEFASPGKPAEITLDLIARPGVDLEQYIGTSSRGSRQMSAMIEEPSILTLAAGWELPLQFKQVLEKSIALVNKELLTRAGFNADTFIATDDLTTSLQDSLEGAREFVLKLSRSEHGFTLYGGIRLSEAERVSNSIEHLLNSLTSTSHTGVIRSRDASGRTYLSYRPSHLTGFLAQTAREQFPTETHLTVEGSTLWFSFGPPDSLDVLSQALDRTEQVALDSSRTRFPLMLLDAELDLLLVDEEETEETTGFDRVPQLALQNLSEKIPKQNGLGTQKLYQGDHYSACPSRTD